MDFSKHFPDFLDLSIPAETCLIIFNQDHPGAAKAHDINGYNETVISQNRYYCSIGMRTITIWWVHAFTVHKQADSLLISFQIIFVCYVLHHAARKSIRFVVVVSLSANVQLRKQKVNCCFLSVFSCCNFLSF